MQEALVAEHLCIEQWEHYQKQGLRNRCKILGAEGTITLGVPLIGGREQRSLMKDVRINHATDWRRDHVRAIRSCYSKAPFFEFYFDGVEMILSRQHEFLLDLNMEVLQMVMDRFKWRGQITLSATYHRPEQVVDQLTPKKQLQPYLQVFSDRLPFHADLSVLDILFCEGPAARKIITG